MKVLIWLACFVLGAIMQTAFGMLAGGLGGFTVILVMGLMFYLAYYLCRQWDEYKAKGNTNSQTRPSEEESEDYNNAALTKMSETTNTGVSAETTEESNDNAIISKVAVVPNSGVVDNNLDEEDNTKSKTEEVFSESEATIAIEEQTERISIPYEIAQNSAGMIDRTPDQTTISIPDEKDDSVDVLETSTMSDSPCFCGKCGNSLIPNKKFCIYCGEPILDVTQIKTISSIPTTMHSAEQSASPEQAQVSSKPRHPRRKTLITVICTFVVVLAVLFGGYWYSYSRSVRYAGNQDFFAADRWLIVPGITEMHNPSLLSYIRAGKYYDDGAYEQAHEAFSKLGNYMDSEALSMESLYQLATEVYKDGNQEQSRKYYKELAKADYKDSKKILFNNLFESGDFKEAYEFCTEANLSAKICGENHRQYMEGMIALEDGEYEAAREIFISLGDFLDADERLKEVYYSIGTQLLKNGNPAVARVNFKHAGDYLDSETMLLECKYQSALNFLEDGRAKAALKEFSELSGYSEADEKIAEAKQAIYEEAKSNYYQSVSAYKERGWGSFSKERQSFKLIDSYAYSSAFLTLIDGFTETPSATIYKKLLSLIDYENSQYLLLSKYRKYYMVGTWRTAGGSYYIKFDEDLTSWYDLPRPGDGGTYTMKDGIYSVNSTKYFKFTIIDKNTMSVYCYSNGSTYTLYRQ